MADQPKPPTLAEILAGGLHGPPGDAIETDDSRAEPMAPSHQHEPLPPLGFAPTFTSHYFKQTSQIALAYSVGCVIICVRR